ncbi:MAG: hypothetical protein KGY70_19820 [Bacteroidales bacterium]|nr:hypothetical protein [Bacteroidales bacterium]
MKDKKLGYLETYNKEADMIEKSSDRQKSYFALFMAFLIVAGQIWQAGSMDDWGFVAIVFIFLLYSAAPKALKEIAALKNFASDIKGKD